MNSRVAGLAGEARRTFKRHVAGRRVVDVAQPGGPELAAVTTGHLAAIAAPADGVVAHARRSQPLVELRVSFTVDRQQVDDVETRRWHSPPRSASTRTPSARP